MRMLWVTTLLLALTATCPAQQTKAEFDWVTLAKAGQLPAGTALQNDGRSALRVANTNDSRLLVTLLQIPAPPVSQRLYALVGEVRYEGVRGDGFLELWNCFPPPKPGMAETRYFSRTTAESGEMGKLTGSSGWRKFRLPFDPTGASGAPTRLEFNLVLPGSGAVFLGPVRLVEYGGGASGGMSPPAWWSEKMGGMVGGIGGATLGCLASLLAWLASRGRARGLVVGLSFGLIALGGVFLLLGLVALASSQPYAVWFPLVLAGALVTFILTFRLKRFQKHYEQIELRRMVSIDG